MSADADQDNSVALQGTHRRGWWARGAARRLATAVRRGDEMWLPDVTILRHASPNEGRPPEDSERDARTLQHQHHPGHLQPRYTRAGRGGS